MTATFHASGNGGQDTGLSSFTVTCTITAGDSIVIYAGWDAASTTTPTVATAGGAGSDSFTLVYGPVNDLNSDKVGVWLLQSAGTGRTGVTVSWASSNPAFAAGFAVSFTGLVAPTLDQFVVGGANANTGNTPTLTSADEIAFQLGLSTVAIASVNAPWTGDGPASGIENLTNWGGGHRILAATTPIASNFTNSSGNWQAYVWTIKAGGTVPVVPFMQFGAAARRLVAPAILAGGLFWTPQPIAASPSNTVTIDKWQQPFSKAVPVAQAMQGIATVPFNTPQVAAFVPRNWQQPLSIPLPVAQALPGYAIVPFNTAQTNTSTVDKWLQPLSKAVALPTFAQGTAFVPFNTPQQVVGLVTYDKYQQPLSVAPSVNQAQQGASFVPFNTPRVVAAPYGWQQPLSVAPAVAKTALGISFVPFNTAQIAPTGISGMAWFMPLGTAPLSVVYKPQQYGIAPVQFGVIAPSPVPPPIVTTPQGGGGGTTGYRLLSNGHYGQLSSKARKKRLQREYDEALAVLLLLS